MRKRTSLLSIPEIITGIVISVLLVLFSLTGTFKSIGLVTSSISKEVELDSYNFFASVREEFEFFGTLGRLRDERDSLKAENITLKAENIDLVEQLEDAATISKQLKFDLPYDLLPVRVIKYDESQVGEILINKGSESNISVGSVVVLDDFAVGEVIEVQNSFSRVQLITSPNSLVPVISIKNKARGIVKGKLGLALELGEVLVEKNLKSGERVVTTGINSSFPKGLNIGFIGEIESVKSELTKTASVTSEIEFNNLTELFVVQR
ncbi:MAG: rod shape-determining protein MreC [Candidatus Dojkabacteria bacterium]